jgi:hypothetical protein
MCLFESISVVSLGLLFNLSFHFRSFAFWQIPMCFAAYVDGFYIMQFVLRGNMWFWINIWFMLNMK